MPSLPSIALHVGLHKTATTHLQFSFEKNKEDLIARGVRYFGPQYLRGRSRDLGRLFGMVEVKGARAPMEQLAFLAKDGHRLIFSEENFLIQPRRFKTPGGPPPYSDAPERVAALCGQLPGVSVDIFVSLRNPVTFLASIYSQLLASGYILQPSVFARRRDPLRLDWVRLISGIAHVPQVRRVYCWQFEEYNDVKERVLADMAGRDAVAGFEFEPRRANASLSAAGIKWFLQQHKVNPAPDLFRRAREVEPVSEGGEQLRIYDRDHVIRATAQYRAQLDEISSIEKVSFIRA